MPMLSDSVVETARMTKFYRGEFSHLIGRTITDVRAMYEEEMETMLWYGERGAVFTLDNGGMFIPMSDSEGNGVGYLMIQEGRNA
jgi:hypothetical protein